MKRLIMLILLFCVSVVVFSDVAERPPGLDQTQIVLSIEDDVVVADATFNYNAVIEFGNFVEVEISPSDFQEAYIINTTNQIALFNEIRKDSQWLKKSGTERYYSDLVIIDPILNLGYINNRSLQQLKKGRDVDFSTYKINGYLYKQIQTG